MACPYESLEWYRPDDDGRKFLFVDRDGTINYDSPIYVKNLAEVRLIPNAIAALAYASAAGWTIVLVTNQPAIGKGLTTHSAVTKIHTYLRDMVRASGGEIAQAYYCTHPRGSDCPMRKPRAGMLHAAAADFDMTSDEIERAWYIGDSEDDAGAAEAFGCNFARVMTGRAVPDCGEAFIDITSAIVAIVAKNAG